MSFLVGSLVQGKKPWNKQTYIGIILEHNLPKEDPDYSGSDLESFKVFWLNRPENKYAAGKRTFCSWEIATSFKRVDKDV